MIVSAAAAYIPLLLRCYWILATCSVICALFPVPLPVSLKNAVWASASRGKLWSYRPRVLGPLNDLSVPQAWFLHFYIVGAVVNATVLLLFSGALSHASGGLRPQAHEALLGLLIFEFHLVRRLLETAFVMRYPQDAKMHVIAYAFGLSYYMVVPLTILPIAVFTPLPTLQGISLGGACTAAWRALHYCLGHHSLAHILGLLVFFNANVVQFASHLTLARLSRGHEKKESGFYSIPKGGLFEYVSCPHYLAEILIYAGLAMVLRGTVNSLLMVAWVSFNLILAANATHRWYHLTFKNYPKERSALLPGIY